MSHGAPNLSINPRHTALVIIDLQNDFLAPDGAYARGGAVSAAAQALPPRVAAVAKALKAAGGMVVGSQFTLWPDAQGEPMVVSETPDADDLLDVAARSGYVVWTFRPVHGGIWADVSDDATLRADGTRKPPCPHHPVPPGGRKSRHTVYRFGVSEGGITVN